MTVKRCSPTNYRLKRCAGSQRIMGCSVDCVSRPQYNYFDLVWSPDSSITHCDSGDGYNWNEFKVTPYVVSETLTWSSSYWAGPVHNSPVVWQGYTRTHANPTWVNADRCLQFAMYFLPSGGSTRCAPGYNAPCPILYLAIGGSYPDAVAPLARCMTGSTSVTFTSIATGCSGVNSGYVCGCLRSQNPLPMGTFTGTFR